MSLHSDNEGKETKLLVNNSKKKYVKAFMKCLI